MSRRLAPIAAVTMAALVSTLAFTLPASARSASNSHHLVPPIAASCTITVTGENNTAERIDVLSIRSTNRAGVTQQFTFGNTRPMSLIAFSITGNSHASFPAVANGDCLGDVQYTVHLRKGRVEKDVVFPTPAAFTTNKSITMGDASKYF